MSIALAILLGMISAGGTANAQADPPSSPQAAAPEANGTGAVRYHPNRVSKRAGEYYGLIWGVDSLSVRAVESGALIRFTYRILDPEKAKILNDKKVDAFLDCPAKNVRLSIPSLEKVGQLRQGTTEEAGKSYWMAFSNPRRTIKRGDRVNVVIGKFHADGLIVE
jgi:hypothetical protein